MMTRMGQKDAVPKHRLAVAALVGSVVYIFGSLLLGLLRDSASPELPLWGTWFIRGVVLLVAVAGVLAVFGTFALTSPEVTETGIFVRTLLGHRQHLWADVVRVRRNPGGDGPDAIEIEFATGLVTLDLDVFPEKALLETLQRAVPPGLLAAAQPVNARGAHRP